MPEKRSSETEAGGVRALAESGAENIDDEIEAMEIVSGKNFIPTDLSKWCSGYKTVGFQGTHLHQAIEELRAMKEKEAKMFLGFTSNLVSSGLRDILCALLKGKCFQVVASTAGGIEEDIIKTLEPTRMGEFTLQGATLRAKGLNRVGNVLIPNKNYFVFEEWLLSLLDDIVDGKIEEPDTLTGTGAQKRQMEGYRRIGNVAIITPSRLIYELGRRAKSEESICYWGYKNGIPIYCPGITDGSIGDIITCYKRRSQLIIDVVEDIASINREGVFSERTGALILGAGIVKHHILNANLFRNGLDHCVLVNTAQEYDGSDAGAQIDEAVSWGKIKKHTSSVKVHADATIILPIIFAAAWPEMVGQ
ncbi:deoxyhypusine synthase [Nematocida displodere]|uniref:deoxyhypusine synthase n=1 Tax=Nematocida displodere TaxID=1805483 RepID=A0A177EGW1_9MICR|nr:deoxyhypusine synthase [Nematocida displodere]